MNNHKDFCKETTEIENEEKEGTRKLKSIRQYITISFILLGKFLALLNCIYNAFVIYFRLSNVTSLYLWKRQTKHNPNNARKGSFANKKEKKNPTSHVTCKDIVINFSSSNDCRYSLD